ncbi:DUF6296 family protein [Kitasatospora sp. NPDC001175]|uniref:DUF6296 family protein n=1 Tax=Kitasatospora sp. NPDC001175 TaxID=3157103 RepID=UPI003D05AC72
MTAVRRYGITLPGAPGSHGPPTVIVVYLTSDLTADGRPVYADDSGAFRVQITDEDVAQPLADTVSSSGGRGQEQCLHAEALPPPGGADGAGLSQR